MKRGRPTNDDLEQRARDTAIAALDEIALQGAKAAMKTLVDAASGARIDTAVLNAAQYIVNRVAGKPVDAIVSDDQTAQVRTLLEEIRNARYARGNDEATPGEQVRTIGSIR